MGTTPGISSTKGLSGAAKFGLAFEIDLLDSGGSEISNPTFTSPLSVTVTYDQAVIDTQGIDENKLQVFFFNTSTNQWEELVVLARDITNNTITFQVNHLTEFAVLSNETTIYLPLVMK